MRTKLRDHIMFGVTVTGLIAALKVMNWLPAAVQDGMMKQYGSFLEVKGQLRLQDCLCSNVFSGVFTLATHVYRCTVQAPYRRPHGIRSERKG